METVYPSFTTTGDWNIIRLHWSDPYTEQRPTPNINIIINNTLDYTEQILMP